MRYCISVKNIIVNFLFCSFVVFQISEEGWKPKRKIIRYFLLYEFIICSIARALGSVLFWRILLDDWRIPLDDSLLLLP